MFGLFKQRRCSLFAADYITVSSFGIDPSSTIANGYHADEVSDPSLSYMSTYQLKQSGQKYAAIYKQKFL